MKQVTATVRNITGYCYDVLVHTLELSIDPRGAPSFWYPNVCMEPDDISVRGRREAEHLGRHRRTDLKLFNPCLAGISEFSPVDIGDNPHLSPFLRREELHTFNNHPRVLLA
jgi:hypothetical protein